MATSVSQSFNRSSAAGNSSSSSRPTLPSVSRKQAPSHRFSPYSREKGKKKSAREPRRYDMKLSVVDHIPELFGLGSQHQNVVEMNYAIQHCLSQHQNVAVMTEPEGCASK